MRTPCEPRAPATSTHRFNRSALLADGARAAVGLGLTLGPLILLDTATAVTWILGALAVLFGWFAARTLVRHRSRIVVSPDGVDLLGPRPTAVRWANVGEMRLAYFAPRRAQERQGWLQLTLREHGGRTLRLDSTLERFDDLLCQVYEIVRAADLPLDPTTSSNLAALGLGPGVTNRGRADGRSASPKAPMPS